MSSASRLTTRVLLVCAALAAVHVLVHLATVPLLTALAPFSPPLYALAAGLHSVMPFLARRLTATPGTATITAGIAAVFIAAANPSGIIVVVPLLLAGLTIDLVVWRSDRARASRISNPRYFAAAVVAGTLLLLVSLSVFSPEHLTVIIVVGTWIGRVAGELLAAAVSLVLWRSLRRAGVGRSLGARP